MTVTSLAFRRAGPGRHPVPHKNKTVGGRRLGLEMQGNLFSLGYFSASVCFGTPAQRFDLIIDTGSSLTAVPCADCSHCGSHQHASYVNARYDSQASSTFSAVGSRPYSVSYTEGSSIRGRIVRDVAWFEELGAGGRRVACPTAFGCQTYESGLFNTQVADGISGFSRLQSYGATLFDSLREATGAPDVFSICLDKEVGAMVLGGTVRPDLQLDWIPYSGSDLYSVQLTEIRHDGAGRLGGQIGSAIIDSGTSFMYLPPSVYAAVRDLWRSNCPWGECRTREAAGQYPDDYCYRINAAVLAGFDWLSLHFGGGVSLRMGPLDYAYELYQDVWCLGVFDNERPGGVIGALNMRHHEVIFDRQHSRIAFAPTDCKALHDGTVASALEGGYGVNGCAGTATSPPPPPSPQAPLLSPPRRSPPPPGSSQSSPQNPPHAAWHQPWPPPPPPPPPLPPLPPLPPPPPPPPSLPSRSPPLRSLLSPASVTAAAWHKPWTIVAAIAALCVVLCLGLIRWRRVGGRCGSGSSTAALHGGTSRVRVIGLGTDVTADGVDRSRSGCAPATARVTVSRSRQRLRARAAAFASKASKYKNFDAKEVEAQAAELQTMTEMSNAVGSDSERSEANIDAQL